MSPQPGQDSEAGFTSILSIVTLILLTPARAGRFRDSRAGKLEVWTMASRSESQAVPLAAALPVSAPRRVAQAAPDLERERLSVLGEAASLPPFAKLALRVYFRRYPHYLSDQT